MQICNKKKKKYYTQKKKMAIKESHCIYATRWRLNSSIASMQFVPGLWFFVYIYYNMFYLFAIVNLAVRTNVQKKKKKKKK